MITGLYPGYSSNATLTFRGVRTQNRSSANRRNLAGRFECDRLARIDAIPSQIASGAYDTPERLDVAIDRMLGALGIQD